MEQDENKSPERISSCKLNGQRISEIDSNRKFLAPQNKHRRRDDKRLKTLDPSERTDEGSGKTVESSLGSRHHNNMAFAEANYGGLLLDKAPYEHTSLMIEQESRSQVSDDLALTVSVGNQISQSDQLSI